MKKLLITALTTMVVGISSVNISFAETTLTNLLATSLVTHEDVINADKKSEEAGRVVTDALFVYAPDIKITTTNFTDEKREAGSNYDINGDTFDVVWDQTIFDSGKNWADISSARLKSTKAQIELDQARNSHAIKAAEAYLDLIKASEKLATALEAEANTRVIQGQEEIRVEVGSGLASDELKAKQKKAPQLQGFSILYLKVLSVNREALTNFKHLGFSVGNNLLRISPIQAIQYITHPMGKINSLLQTKTTGGNSGSTNAQARSNKGRPRIIRNCVLIYRDKGFAQRCISVFTGVLFTNQAHQH